ncbi:MAG: Rieske (2Fe-2S) protein [Acidiferrobacter sp.]
MAWVAICRSEALQDKSFGVRFRLQDDSEGFVVRYLGMARAFRNRCPHRGLELDWEVGHFFNENGAALICSVHGARYDPASGNCLGGPCRGTALTSIACQERAGFVVVEEFTV